MPIVLCRVDERLIHGQVVLGWGGHLRPDRYVVVDDEIALAEWEQDLYRLALPVGPIADTAEFTSIEAAQSQLARWSGEPARRVVLTRDLESVLELARTGELSGLVVNLGGLHYAPSRMEVLPFLHLHESDVERIQWLEQAGVTVEARDLPSAPPVGGAELIRKGKRLWSG